MQFRVEPTVFGYVTIESQMIVYDIIMRSDDSIQKRKKKLPKKVYGISHKISLEEAKYVYEKGQSC